MNVLLAADVFPPRAGGSGRSAAMLASALLRRGHRVRVVVGRSRRLEQSEWRGVEVEEVAIPPARPGTTRARRRALAAGLVRAARNEAWEVVHAQHWLSAGAASEALPWLPLVVTVRDYWPVCIWSTKLSGTVPCPGCTYTRRVVCVGRRRPWLWPLAPLLPPVVGAEIDARARVLTRAKAVIAVSRHVASTLPVSHPHVIPNVIELDEPEPLRPEDAPERYVLFVGKLEPNKAPDELLPMLEAARCEIPLLVAGNGSLEKELADEARRRGRNVRFLGWVDESRALALIRHADALLFPSRWQEPLSRVLVDACALGAAIVAEPTGGTGEILEHETSALLGRGPEELGRALARLLGDEALAVRLREGAKRRARELFSEEAVLPRVESVYATAASP